MSRKMIPAGFAFGLSVLSLLIGACSSSSPDASTPRSDGGATSDAGGSNGPPGSSGDASAPGDAGGSTPSDGGQSDGGAPPLMLHGTVWHVRSDGGTRAQCTGKTDAAYPGSGTAQDCAFGDPRYLYTTGDGSAYAWVVAGGDSVVIAGGPWRIGQDTATTSAFSNQGAADGASIPAPPPGTAAAPTVIVGEHWASCTTKTQLFGGFTVNSVFDLRSTSNVQVACFEITDHSQCTRNGSQPVACNTAIVDDYAKNGIQTDMKTHDITLEDLDIHGFESRGVIGAIGGVVNATRVRVGFNGGAGWDLDDGTKSVNGQMNWSSVTIEGNGCVEEYPVTHAFPAAYCYDELNGGYGDGVGTPDTEVSFAIDHSTVRYNTQDGLDLLHTTGSDITVSDSLFYGNMGQQLKLGPMASVTVRNNLFLTNCNRLSADVPGAQSGFNAGLSEFCRANAGVVMTRRGDSAGTSSYVYQNNDFVGYAGDGMFEWSGCTDTFVSAPTTDCNIPNIVFENNLMVGSPNAVVYNNGRLPPSGTQGSDNAGFSKLDHNIYYNVRVCPTESESVCTDPLIAGEPNVSGAAPIAESLFDAVTFELTAASTDAIGMGIPISGLSTDYAGAPRPNPPSIGAYEPSP